jgi:hypothetical protein
MLSAPGRPSKNFSVPIRVCTASGVVIDETKPVHDFLPVDHSRGRQSARSVGI